MPICVICAADKLDEFFRVKNKKTGTRRCECRDCENAYKRRLRQENPEAVLAYNKRYKADHADEIKAYREQHKDEASDWRDEHKEEVKEYQSSYRAGHKEERKEYMREYQPVYRVLQTDKVKARQLVQAAIRAGDLLPQPCEDCGVADRTQAHHEDYSKPLEVTWLCPSCHGSRRN